MLYVFYLSSFFFLLLGVLFLILSIFMISLNFSIFFYWNFFFSFFSLNFPFYLDYMSCLFMCVVLLISGSILVYSEFYMSGEIYKSRFFYLMFLFVVSMMFLILSPNLLSMLLGWDGLGLVSYCLVIYYQNFSSYNSGMITVLTNRVGDVLILSSISIFFCYGEFSYMNFLSLKDKSFLIFFFTLASMTKSAQIPFSSWLPAAMAAPTPVSSLVHSSTLVTAGVYIMIRFNYFLSSDLKEFILFISLITMIMSGISGVLEFDLKKIIALSTLSQLGFMMASIGLGLSKLAFFHLISHAGFKALMFMCAGLFIHSFFNVQDIRLYGLLTKNYSLILCFFNVANLSLCGFPFLSGFFSKDLILELMLTSSLNFIFWFLFSWGTFLTVFYSFRLFFFLTFNSSFYMPVESNFKKVGVQKSMILLFFFSISLGFFGSNLVFYPFNYIVLPFYLKIFVSFICLTSVTASMMFVYISKIFLNLFTIFLSQMWFLGSLGTGYWSFILFNESFKVMKVLIVFIEKFNGLKTSNELSYFSYFFSKSMKVFFNLYFFLFFLVFISFLVLFF